MGRYGRQLADAQWEIGFRAKGKLKMEIPVLIGALAARPDLGFDY
jgi:hypothetical protein